MTRFYNEYAIKLFKSFYEKYKRSNSLSEKDLSFIFDQCLDFMEMPKPSKEMYKYFINPLVVSMILMEIHNYDRLTYDDRKKISKFFDHMFSLLKRKKSQYFLQYRILGAQGYYPDCELKKNNWHYLIQNMLPVLITKNKYTAEYEFLNYSEIGWITRNELKIATAIQLALDESLVHFYFNDYNKYEIDYSVIEQIPKQFRLFFLSELMALTNRFIPLNDHFRTREITADVTNYMYRNFNNYETFVYKLTDAFSIRNHLLLRTSTHFLKSIMLWHNRSFGEEALVNTYFCVEGCLHLLQKKFGNYSTKLDLNFIKKIFIDNFPLGEQIFDSLKEDYETRIQLVHPETDWGTEWNPFIMADDFYANFSFCRVLLNFILIVRIIEE